MESEKEHTLTDRKQRKRQTFSMENGNSNSVGMELQSVTDERTARKGKGARRLRSWNFHPLEQRRGKVSACQRRRKTQRENDNKTDAQIEIR